MSINTEEFEEFLLFSVVLIAAHGLICNDSIELEGLVQTAKSILKLVLMKSCGICGIPNQN